MRRSSIAIHDAQLALGRDRGLDVARGDLEDADLMGKPANAVRATVSVCAHRHPVLALRGCDASVSGGAGHLWREVGADHGDTAAS